MLGSDFIYNAVVLVNSGEYSLSGIRERAAAATVMLVLEGDYVLSSEQVGWVTQIMLDAVSGLEYENITIVDRNLNFYCVEGARS